MGLILSSCTLKITWSKCLNPSWEFPHPPWSSGRITQHKKWVLWTRQSAVGYKTGRTLLAISRSCDISAPYLLLCFREPRSNYRSRNQGNHLHNVWKRSYRSPASKAWHQLIIYRIVNYRECADFSTECFKITQGSGVNNEFSLNGRVDNYQMNQWAARIRSNGITYGVAKYFLHRLFLTYYSVLLFSSS